MPLSASKRKSDGPLVDLCEVLHNLSGFFYPVQSWDLHPAPYKFPTLTSSGFNVDRGGLLGCRSHDLWDTQFNTSDLFKKKNTTTKIDVKAVPLAQSPCQQLAARSVQWVGPVAVFIRFKK